ncbi:hypothetical protein [Lysinibacillus fusiformis]
MLTEEEFLEEKKKILG